jgi:hypothetical protein
MVAFTGMRTKDRPRFIKLLQQEDLEKMVSIHQAIIFTFFFFWNTQGAYLCIKKE